jgi:hypothetical protein
VLPAEEDPLDEDPVELDLLAELEALVDVTGEGSGMNGSRVGPRLW